MALDDVAQLKRRVCSLKGRAQPSLSIGRPSDRSSGSYRRRRPDRHQGDALAIRLTQHETITRDLSQSQHEKFGAVMSNNIETIAFYRVVVRRGAVIKPAGVVRKPFVWEIRHKETAQLFGSSAEPFASMEEAHRFGLMALARLST